MRSCVLSFSLKLIVFTLFVMQLSGCGDDNTTVIQGAAEANGIVTGRVVDSSTLQPIKNAEVTLIVNGEKMTTQSNTSDDPDLAGTFVFRGISATYEYSYGHTLKIASPGYAMHQRRITVAQSNDNAPVTMALGDIALGKGYDLQVFVSDSGVPVSGVTVRASSGLVATTNNDGIALLRGLNQERRHTISSVPYYDATDTLKYLSSAIDVHFLELTDDKIVSLPLDEPDVNDAIEIVASDLLDSGNYAYYGPRQNTITTTREIKLIFNYPVTLTGPVTASYINDLIAETDPDYGKVLTISTLSAALDTTGTVLSITNSAPYNKNQTYTFHGTLSTPINGFTQTIKLNNIPDNNRYFANEIYVADDTSTGLNPATTVKADNFNGTSGPTATTSPARVYLVFPEAVYGSFRVLTTRSGATTAVVNGPFSDLSYYGEILYSGNNGGNDETAVYRVSGYSLVNLADNGATEINEITIWLDATDAEGNTLSGTMTLPVY